MRRTLLLIALVLALPAAARAQDPLATPPSATTGSAKDVTRTSATVTGTVDPNGSATTYHFEYGTATSYGLTTPDGDAGSGDSPVAAEAPLAGLTPGTTYHYRVVATSANGTTNGADRTLRTVANPRPPAVTKTGTAAAGADFATVRSTVDPNGSPTEFHVEYGSSRSYGSRTPDRDAGASTRGAQVTETIGGLKPFRRYHFRVVATNEAGTVTSADHSFVTSRLPTSVTLAVDAPSTPWGEGVEVFGQVSGVGRNGIPVGVERQDFPFGGPFSSAGMPLPVRADRFGRFRIFIPVLFTTTRLRAVTRTAIVATSPTVQADVALKVGAGVRRASKRRMRIRGAVRPAAPDGRAVLQRRTATGGWTFVRGADLRPLGSSRSRYSFTVARIKKSRQFRVRVIARDGGAHVPGTSRRVTVKRLPRR